MFEFRVQDTVGESLSADTDSFEYTIALKLVEYESGVDESLREWRADELALSTYECRVHDTRVHVCELFEGEKATCVARNGVAINGSDGARY